MKGHWYKAALVKRAGEMCTCSEGKGQGGQIVPVFPELNLATFTSAQLQTCKDREREGGGGEGERERENRCIGSR